MEDLEVREFDEREWGVSWEQLAKDGDEAMKDRMWFSGNMNALRKRYRGKWVGVRSRRIIMADADHDRLLRRLESRRENLASTQIFYVSPRDAEYYF
jgi:hypothetical protein